MRLSARMPLVTVLALLTLAWSAAPALAWDPFRSENDDVARGNEHLEKGRVDEALEAYDSAVRRLPSAPGVQLDRGLALLAKKKHDEARAAFQNATQGNAPAEVRGAAHHGMGLAFMAQADAAGEKNDLETAQKYLREAVDAFKSSLRAKPGNRDAAWNLELARRRLVEVEKKREEQKKQADEKKKQEDEQQQQEEQDQQENSSNQNDAGAPDQPKNEPSDERSDEQKRDGEQGSEPEQTPKGEAGGDEQDAQQKEQPAPKPPENTQQQPSQPEPSQEAQERPTPEQRMPEHMKKALKALEADEQNLEKLRAQMRARQRPRRVEKDW